MTNKLIEKKAESILIRTGTLILPIDVRKIALLEEIDIIEQDLDDDVSGFLVKKSNKNIIGLNKNQHEVRQRFTISHELGHFFIHVDQPLFVDYYRGSKLYRSSSKPSDSKIEKEANIFAASLLMPKILINEELNKLAEKIDYEGKVNKMALRFKVSTQAMDYRLKTLGYYDYGF